MHIWWPLVVLMVFFVSPKCILYKNINKIESLNVLSSYYTVRPILSA